MWWYEAFPQLPYESAPPGAGEMLTLIGYDIACPKRLAKVSKTCQDFGVRVQYSFFECRLEEGDYDELWLRLLDLIDETEDRLVSYKLDARCAKQTETAGTMVCSKKCVLYLI